MYRVLFFKQHNRARQTKEIPQCTNEKHAKTQDEAELEKVKESQRRFTVEYLPLRRPLWNSPTVWESVRSKPTPLALIIFGLWPDWWKKTLLWRFFWGDHNSLRASWAAAFHAQAQDGTLLRTRSSLTSRHLSVQRSYREDYCHCNNRSTPPQHAPPSMHRGCPHKDWQHGCSCTTSRGRARTVSWGLSAALSTLTMSFV